MMNNTIETKTYVIVHKVPMCFQVNVQLNQKSSVPYKKRKQFKNGTVDFDSVLSIYKAEYINN